MTTLTDQDVDTPTNTPTRKMDRYEKVRVIGQGAFGKVFLLRRKSDRINVVIKQIPVDDLPIEERRSSMNEVSVLKMLQHPNIVAYYDSFVEEKSLMIAMEYAPGGTLYEFITERAGKLLLEEHILQLFVQILVAIQHVHSLNILHRDLKPQNIMLNKKRSVVKIGDFGISKVLSTKITSAQTLVGTPCYISPEICEGKAYRKKSDIWALGCVLYELTTLKKAFEGPNLPALVFKIMQAAEGLPPVNKKYSHGLQSLTSSLLQRNPDDRPNTENIMGYPVVVNTLINLGTDVGRLPCSRPKDPNHSAVGVRMGTLGGSHRQKSFFDQDDYQPGAANRHPALGMAKAHVYTWGGGVSHPLRLPWLPEAGRVVNVMVGRSHRMGVTDEGKLIKWELAKGSIATTGLTISSHTKTNEIIEFCPKIAGQSPGSSIVIKQADCGDLFTACLTDKGILMTFGCGINGCLGHGNCDDVPTLELVAKTLEYETVDVACGSNHVLSLTADNCLFAWGRGESGQLGTGAQEECQATPLLVHLPLGVAVKKLVCGPDCSLLITHKLTVYATGSNKYNKLGLDPPGGTYLPLLAMSGRINDLTETSMIMSSVFKSADTPTDTPLATPTLSTPPTSTHIEKVWSFQQCQSPLMLDITDASISYNHSAFINVSGQCITSGHNGRGQLGREGEGAIPSVVTSLHDKHVQLVSCGDAYTVACTKDGGIYTWGDPGRGRLGRSCEGGHGTDRPGVVHFETGVRIHSLSTYRDVTMSVVSELISS